MKTAVIIPVKNEMSGLDILIQSLLTQVDSKDEIIFVDAGSTDGTLEFLETAARLHPDTIKIVRSPGSYPGAARNAGIASTDAEIIAQIDGGNIPHVNWLQELKQPILIGKADHVTGNVLAMPIYRRIGKQHIDLGEIYSASLIRGRAVRPGPDKKMTSMQQPRFCAGGANTAYLHRLWQETGGFPEWIRSGEDPLFIRKLKDKAIRYVWAENAIVYWQIGPHLRHILKRHFNNQRAKFRSIELLKNNIPSIVPYLLLPILLVASIFSVTLFYILMILILGITGIQTAKSLYTFFRRTKQDTLIQNAAAVILMPWVEFLGIFAKIIGTYKGITELCSSQHRKDWTDRVTKYLDR
jgi:glycosyltransferase involved in cell wall biosynthesis